MHILLHGRMQDARLLSFRVFTSLCLIFSRFLGFVFLLPGIQMTVICMAIGNDPKSLHFGIVNNEIRNFSECLTATNKCGGGNLSCTFIKLIPEDDIIKVCSITSQIYSILFPVHLNFLIFFLSCYSITMIRKLKPEKLSKMELFGDTW